MHYPREEGSENSLGVRKSGDFDIALLIRGVLIIENPGSDIFGIVRRDESSVI